MLCLPNICAKIAMIVIKTTIEDTEPRTMYLAPFPSSISFNSIEINIVAVYSFKILYQKNVRHIYIYIRKNFQISQLQTDM